MQNYLGNSLMVAMKGGLEMLLGKKNEGGIVLA